MINNIGTYSQQSLNYYGFVSNSGNKQFRMNTIESNPANFNAIDDWEFSLSINSRISKQNNLNLKLISLGKRIVKHYLYARYTPSIKEEFIFNSRTEFLVGDTLQNYKTYLAYNEKYAFGYSYDFSNLFTFGFSFRYLQQDFNEEFPTFYSDSTIQIIQIRNEFVRKNFWRGDLSVVYKFADYLNLSFATNNLIILKDFDREDNNSDFGIKKTTYNIKQEKSVVFGFDYFSQNFSLDYNLESNGSFTFGLNHGFVFDKSYVTIGATLFHDKYQQPFIAGILPSISYTNNLFGLTISYLKYLNDRTDLKNLNDFKKYGIHNIENNFFTQNKLSLTFNFALSFKNFQKVKFMDVEITNEIFPTFVDNYIQTPIAYAKVINLTEDHVSVKPSTLIKIINSEVVYSPIFTIPPNDTAYIPFFIIIDEKIAHIKKTTISNLNLYLSTDKNDADDKISRPILIYSNNNWDGNVKNLKYFVNADLDFAKKNVLKVLELAKADFKNIDIRLMQFKQIKLLYNSFVKDMKYVADRRTTSDYVQFPSETFEAKGGDCDDLSVAFSALLESIGIQTAFIDYKPKGTVGHVALLVNTKLSPNESNLITINDRKYFVRKNVNDFDEVWIPLEMTTLTNFEEGWNKGAAKFYEEAINNLGLSKSSVEVVDIF